MEIPGTRLGTRRTQLRVPSVEDPYVLLAIQYMSIICLQGAAVGGAMLSMFYLSVLYVLACLYRVPWLALYMQPA